VADAPLVELRDATVVLGGARVLDRITLTIPAGQHTSILGANGAGKSTLVRLLTLQQYPLAADDEVPIRVFGRERWDVFALRSQLGIVSADLHDRFVQGNANGVVTAVDAVTSGFFASHGLFAHQRVSGAMREAARDALARIGVAHLADTPLATMSTGEARRVLIARALVHHPRALLLDEPTRGLDLVARHRFMERIRAIARGGTTILLVTHYVDEIIPEIERVVLLKGGRVALDAPKAEALEAHRLSEAFDAPIAVDRLDGYYYARALR
jgi:iron complex transport system ATP-binding protein